MLKVGLPTWIHKPPEVNPKCGLEENQLWVLMPVVSEPAAPRTGRRVLPVCPTRKRPSDPHPKDRDGGPTRALCRSWVARGAKEAVSLL